MTRQQFHFPFPLHSHPALPPGVFNTFKLDLHGCFVSEAVQRLDKYLCTLAALEHPGGVLVQVRGVRGVRGAGVQVRGVLVQVRGVLVQARGARGYRCTGCGGTGARGAGVQVHGVLAQVHGVLAQVHGVLAQVHRVRGYRCTGCSHRCTGCWYRCTPTLPTLQGGLP